MQIQELLEKEKVIRLGVKEYPIRDNGLKSFKIGNFCEFHLLLNKDDEVIKLYYTTPNETIDFNQISDLYKYIDLNFFN
jgi:hypothetical protein